MKTPERIASLVIGSVLVLAMPGCGDAKKEAAAQEKERQRIELEKQAQADATKANKAITTNNQKMFSRMNSSTPGSQPAQAYPPAAETPPTKK